MTKVLIVNFGGSYNKGGAALVNSMIETIRLSIPDVTFSALSHHANYNQYPIRIIETVGNNSTLKVGLRTLLLLFKSGLWITYKQLMNKEPFFFKHDNILLEYINSDLIINTGGDNLTEDYGLSSLIFNFCYLLNGIILKKPVILYAESIGPFRNKISVILARFILNHTNLITVREEISMKNLSDININRVPIHLTADSAFLLKPIDKQRIADLLANENLYAYDLPIIGFSVSKIISRYGFVDIDNPEYKYEEYIEVMSKTIDTVIDKYNAIVVIVPHVIDPKNNDDRWVANDICEKINNISNVVSVQGDYTPEELKGIIGSCHLFVGARMHATIASTSMLVPTIGIAYSHKIYGIIGDMLGQSEYILDVKNLTYECLVAKIDDAWKNKDKIRKDLSIKIPQVKEKAMLNGKLVKNLLDDY